MSASRRGVARRGLGVLVCATLAACGARTGDDGGECDGGGSDCAPDASSRDGGPADGGDAGGRDAGELPDDGGPGCDRSYTECSAEETRRLLSDGYGTGAFGAAWSAIDERGCLRAMCASDAECGAGKRCVDRALVYPPRCVASTFSCGQDDGECGCGVSGDCDIAAHCVDAERFPETAECDFDPGQCEVLDEYVSTLTTRATHLRDRGHEELHERIAACARDVAAALLELPDACAPASDPCHLLCDLHDCEGIDDCRDRCASARTELDAAELRDIVARAAGVPGACTCDLCDADTAPFCASVWGCSSG